MPRQDWEFNPRRKRRKQKPKKVKQQPKPVAPPVHKETKHQLEVVLHMLRWFNGNHHQLARMLGTSERTLYRWQADTVRIPDVGVKLIKLLQRLEADAPWLLTELIERAKQGLTH